MKKSTALLLKKESIRMAKEYSSTDRENNPTGELFDVKEVIALNDHTAVVIYEKNIQTMFEFLQHKKREIEMRNFKYNE